MSSHIAKIQIRIVTDTTMGSRMIREYPYPVDSPARDSLIEAVAELTRLAELDGCGDELATRVATVRAECQKWVQDSWRN